MNKTTPLASWAPSKVRPRLSLPLSGSLKANPEKYAALQVQAVALNIELKVDEEGVLALYEVGRFPFSKRFITLAEVSVWLDAVGVNLA